MTYHRDVSVLDELRAALQAEVERSTRPALDSIEELRAALSRLEKTIIRQAPAKRARAGAPKLRADRYGVVSLELHGLRVRAVVDAGVPMAAGWLVWPGGQAREPAAYAGAAATTAALLTRGNATHSGDEISRNVDGRAASLDGFAGRFVRVLLLGDRVAFLPEEELAFRRAGVTHGRCGLRGGAFRTSGSGARRACRLSLGGGCGA